MRTKSHISFFLLFFSFSVANFLQAKEKSSPVFNFTPINGDSSLIADAGNDTTLTCLTTEVEIGRIVSEGANISYQWYEHEHGIIVGDTPNLLVFGPGTYTLTVFDNQTGQSASDEITIFEDKKSPEIQINGVTNLDCVIEKGDLSVFSINQSPDLDFQWYLDQQALEYKSSQIEVGTAGLYSVVVTNPVNGCSAEKSIKIEKIEGIKQVELHNIAPRCTNEAKGIIEISNIQGGEAPFLYSLNDSPFSVHSIFSQLSFGHFSLKIEDANGCIWEEDIHFEEPPVFELQVSPNLAIFPNETVHLSVSSNQTPIQVHWSDSSSLNCGSCTHVIAKPVISTLYALQATNADGCRQDASIKVEVLNEAYYAPNVFNPLGVGENTRFTIYAGNAIQSIEQLDIYDRWGTLVFSKKDIQVGDSSEGWDGTLNGETLPNGIYPYKAILKIEKRGKKSLMGEVLLQK